MTRFRIAACIFSLLMLSSCQSIWTAESVESGLRAAQFAPSPYRAFNAALEAEYIAIAHRKLDEADFERVDFFVRKGLAAGNGDLVLPEKPDDWLLPDTLARELKVARQKLLRALEEGARSEWPREAAHAQAMYDCWIDRQDITDESRRPDHIHACQQNFWGALALIELVIAPKPKLQPEPQPGPVPEMMTRTFLAYSL